MAKRGSFFVRLCYGYVGRHKDTSKMTTKEVIEEFLKRKGVSSPREFFQNKFVGLKQSGETSGAESRKKVGLQFFALKVNEISNILNSFSNENKAQEKFLELVTNGQVNLKIKDAQNKHIVGTNQYEIEQGKNEKKEKRYPSILTENAELLVKKHAGRGKLMFARGKWLQKEKFIHNNSIGTYMRKDGANLHKTNSGIIHYSNEGVHIVPSRAVEDVEEKE